ncbi:MAG: long-chain-fatty-acid--[acyl-carrier-protein] ligase [Verrucomicrobiota bacterium]|jgi:acyl-[acyl-carrier-protein]-phospholipid O-acyltransferase/long-chain-fatty-acid--[acyl-carrier-protein] ligase
MRAVIRIILNALFRFRTFNEKCLNTPGPVLLIPNHVSLIDWLLLGVCLEPDWKFVVSSVVAEKNWIYRLIMKNRRTFPVDTMSPYGARHMAEYLQKGGRLVLFAEGRITQTGAFMKLFEGTGFLLHKTHAQVITAYIRNAVRLPFLSYHSNLKQWRPPISLHFSKALTPPSSEGMTTAQARQFLTEWLRDAMVHQQFETEMTEGPATILAAIVDNARARKKQPAFDDINRSPVTYKRVLIGAEALASVWRRQLHESEGNRVGVMLPGIGATPVVLLSLWAAGHVPAILNFTSGAVTLTQCSKLAGLKQIITSRNFLEKGRIDTAPLEEAGIELLYLEDVKSSISPLTKLASATIVALGAGPSNVETQPNDTAVILFTSGSEGIPKGVELTHTNLLANIRQMLAVTDFEDHDRLLNSLPLFHSFGLTVGTLLPLVRGMFVFFYPSPLHYRVIPALAYDQGSTVLIGTNTFLNGYARRSHPYDFHRVRYLFAGAEKVQEATLNTWSRVFGVRILEGYGATECSPAISVNTPMSCLTGSAGRIMPGMEWRTESVPGVPEGGRLFVRGPNIMRGYLNPEPNAAFQALNGWYDTGDIAHVDQRGFVSILGRLKRFAKVSGEMISLTAVEDALAGAFPQYAPKCEVAVISRPDSDKGEMLIAVTNEPRLKMDEIRTAIRNSGLSNLAVPRKLITVREIPKLGTGKVDHRTLTTKLDSPTS